jgi:hypothetical protein
MCPHLRLNSLVCRLQASWLNAELRLAYESLIRTALLTNQFDVDAASLRDSFCVAASLTANFHSIDSMKKPTHI